MRATVERLRQRTSREAVSLRDMIRRAIVSLGAASGLWQAIGVEDAGGNKETFDDVPVFSGIGYFSRPSSDGEPECIVLNVGGKNGHPVIVATRDKSIQASIDEDETAIFNSTRAQITLKKNGDVWIDAKPGGKVYISDGSGGTSTLPTWDSVANHVHTGGTISGFTGPPSTIDPTTVLEAK